MAILKIARMGHPVLSRRAEDITDPTAPEIRALAQDMLETMVDAPGVGLAAPQVHVPLRMVIFRAPVAKVLGSESHDDPESPDRPEEGPEERPLTVLINPILEPQGDGMAEDWEGCLSVPGLRGKVPRYLHLRYRGVNLSGAPIDRTVTGFHARVVQHECDHLDGILYPQRMTNLRKLIFESEMRHAIAEASTPEHDEAGADA